MIPLQLTVALLAFCALVQAAPRLVAPDDHKILMIDPRIVAWVDNARLVPGTVQKEAANPLFQADRPWENALNNLYPNLLWDEEDKLFKLWYKCVLADPDAIAKMDRPSTVHDVGWYLLYATSRDGIQWEKPELGLHAFEGNSATNIVARDTPNVGVFKDPHDPDPARRYKMVYDVGLGKLRARFSPDGIHWSDPLEMLGFGARNGDTHNNAFWDERTGKYLWFTKLYLGERLAARYESTDFLNWKNNGMVMRSTLAEGRASQTYCMPAFRYANGYLAWLMMYHPGKDRSVDCELAWSPDGLTWRRVFPGTPFIPRGTKGSYDSECIYAMSGPPVEENGQLLIFYGGDDFPHTGWKRDCVPCLARLPVDHFGGYQPVEEKIAFLMTEPLQIHPEGLSLTMEANGGSITVAQVEGEMRVSRVESLPVTSSGTVRWRVEPSAAPHRLWITLDKATLYAVSGVSLVNEALPSTPAPLPSPGPVVSRRVSFDTDAQGWKGVDVASHHPEGGASGGYLSVSREGRNLPIALSPSELFVSPFAGDWPISFGGRGARLSCFVRSQKPGGHVQFEIFAGDLSQWSFATKSTFTGTWQEVTATLRYDWTDDEAKAAGWSPSAAAFPWAQTIRNAGKLVIVPVAADAQSSFDLDEVSVSGLSD